MGRPVSLAPEDQFPAPALDRTVQKFPPPDVSGAGNQVWTWNVASAADQITPWGRQVYLRDRQLRDFWPSETYLAGAMANVAFRNAVFQWEIKGGSEKVNQAVTDILVSALAGDGFGWVPFMQKFSQDLYTQDNGAFIELIRDEGMDANSRFTGPLAPVLGIGNLDSNRCVRTGNPKYPVRYTDRFGEMHKLAWYQVIPFSDFPSAIETMNGVGYCAVTRVLRMAQMLRSIEIYKDEKISGRQYKQIHFVSGVSRQDIKDEMTRGQEEANNSGLIRFIMPSILASLDPEKPVSTASLDLASLPDGFDYDQEMKWYISGLALGFGVDYQEFAPLPTGNMGSGQQSMILDRKGSGKGPAVLMRMLSMAFSNYGVLPRGTQMRFNDKDEQEELERQTVRTKAMEEMAIAINSHALTPRAAAEDMVRRGVWDPKTIASIPESYWLAMETNPTVSLREQGTPTPSGIPGAVPGPVGQPVGNRGGNTIVEDAGRQNTGATSQTVGDRLRKAYEIYTDALREERKANQEEKNMLALFKKSDERNLALENNIVKFLAQTSERNMEHEKNIITVLAKTIGAALESLRKDKPETIIQIPEQPKPVVNVTVKMPRIKTEVQKVVRDGKGNIDYTTTSRTYED